jgi:hypothetical protein
VLIIIGYITLVLIIIGVVYGIYMAKRVSGFMREMH